jgi:type VI secretion system secreted protein VgrG
MNTLPSALQSGWKQTHRLLRLATVLGGDALLPEQVRQVEGIGAQEEEGGDAAVGFKLQLTVLSTDAHLNLADLIGQPARLDLLTQASRSQLRPFHGHITAAEQLASNGGFARYRLVIEPWLAFLRYRSDSFIFQNKSVIQIVESLFADYQNQGKLAPQWRWELADKTVYPKRSLTTQYQETDLAFLQRLLAEEGLYYWFEHASAGQGEAGSSLGSHTLVIADHNAAFKPNAQAQIRYTRADATEAADSLQQWAPRQQIQTSAISIASWDYRSLSSRPVTSQAAQAAIVLTQHDDPGVYAYEDRAQGQRLADNQLAALQATTNTIDAQGTVRTLSPASTFSLADHHTGPGEPASYLVLQVTHQARNNFTEAFVKGVADTLGTSPLAADMNQAQGANTPASKSNNNSKNNNSKNSNNNNDNTPLYTNHFTAIPARVPYKPLQADGHGSQLHPKPTLHGTQTAIVVGTGGSPQHTDRDHRLKIQFHWQRGAHASSRTSHPSTDSADNAPANEQSGTWVRVATPVAGANWGSIFLPRIGQEVLVAFLHGDIDRPIILGSLYNGQGATDAQSNQVAGGAASSTGNASAWFPGEAGAHAHNAVLSGLKTQSLDASQTGSGGYNQLVFDDSAGQSRISLATTQANTQLNLGHLKHQHDNQRKPSLGHGAELTTQGAAALRAGSGILLSTDKRANASSTQLDSREAQTQTEQSQQLAKALIETAQKHNAKLKREGKAEAAPDKLTVITALTQTSKSLKAIDVREALGSGGQAASESKPDTKKCWIEDYEKEISINSNGRYFKKYKNDGSEYSFNFPKKYKILVPVKSGNKLTIEVRFKPVAQTGVTEESVGAAKVKFENGIKSYWGGKFKIEINDPECGGKTLNIEYKIVWVTSGENYTLKIHDTYDREGLSGTVMNVSKDTTDWTYAHEFAHCVGLPDEYSYVEDSTETVKYIKPDGTLDVAVSAPSFKSSSDAGATIMSSVDNTKVLKRHGWNIAIETQELLAAKIGRKITCDIK